MNQSSTLHPVQKQGWGTGFGNLFRQESNKWWGTRRWLKYTIVWVLLANSIPLIIFFDGVETSTAETLHLFIIMVMLVSIVGVIITMQGVIIGEKQSGTVAWLLSKPVSRPAYILARLSGTGLATLLIMLVIPAIAAYGLMTQLGGNQVDIHSFALAMGIAAVFMVFLLTLTLMLGTVFNSRAAVIGIPMALLMFAEFYEGLLERSAPGLLDYDPMMLLELADAVALGSPLGSATPLIATAVWSLLLVVLALWRFGREEF
jgi:ABC-2 type transport system permease protein